MFFVFSEVLNYFLFGFLYIFKCFWSRTTQRVLLMVFLTSGRQKNVTISGFDQNALINLIICKNSELMAGPQYPQTTRSLIKTELLFIYYITIVFVQ